MFASHFEEEIKQMSKISRRGELSERVGGSVRRLGIRCGESGMQGGRLGEDCTLTKEDMNGVSRPCWELAQCRRRLGCLGRNWNPGGTFEMENKYIYFLLGEPEGQQGCWDPDRSHISTKSHMSLLSEARKMISFARQELSDKFLMDAWFLFVCLQKPLYTLSWVYQD